MWTCFPVFSARDVVTGFYGQRPSRKVWQEGRDSGSVILLCLLWTQLAIHTWWRSCLPITNLCFLLVPLELASQFMLKTNSWVESTKKSLFLPLSISLLRQVLTKLRYVCLLCLYQAEFGLVVVVSFPRHIFSPWRELVFSVDYL